jgi:hypothetical protein
MRITCYILFPQGLSKKTNGNEKRYGVKSMEGLSRRDFLRYTGAAGSALFLGIGRGGLVMTNTMSQVALMNTDNRKHGVKASLGALKINPVKGKDVLIKPNFNTADPTPGSTHNDTLAALVEGIWEMGAKSISLGERSYPPTREVMEKKGILSIMDKMDVRVIDFDDLDDKDWVLFKPKKSHWTNGFRIARPILDAECLVSTCCLETPCRCCSHIPTWIRLHG